MQGAPEGLGSLALVPFGRGSVLSHLSDRLLARCGRRPIVLRTFDAGAAYDAAIAPWVTDVSGTTRDFRQRLSKYEPSDWLLIVDPRAFPMNGFDAADLMAGVSQTPRMTYHLVTLASHSIGTQERVELDADGRVRRVQRYYDSVTWTQTAGTVASLVPVSALAVTAVPDFASLTEFRRALGATGAPARDIPLEGPVVDLNDERMLLRLNEVAARATQDPAPPKPTGGRIAPSARLVGPVILQDQVVIEPEVTIVGPSVIGKGAVVRIGATVAQAVVAAGAIVPSDVVIRQRLFTAATRLAEGARLEPPPAALELSVDVPDLVEEQKPRRIYPTVKAGVESIIATLSLILLSPLLALLAVLIKLESPGPIFYGDPREAKDGRLFRCYKFRTMRVGADAIQRELMGVNQVDGPQFKMDHDPRVTRLGRYLRAVSLDELPQLINVALCQMSLVGPRPSPFRENQTCVPWREARLSVRPGITGLWQVCRHERAHGDFHQWIYYDMQYVSHMSFWVDVKILVATVLTLGGKSHVPLSWIIPSATTEGV